jgi:hypothetical protein
VPKTILQPSGLLIPFQGKHFPLFQEAGQIFGMYVIQHVHGADHLFGIVAQRPLPGGTREHQGTVVVYYRDDIKGVLQDRA